MRAIASVNALRRAAANGCVRRAAHEFASVSVGQDQSSIVWQDLGREIGRDRKEQRVAVLAVLGPLLVGAEVGNARFDFNNPNFAVAADGQDVGATAVAERDLAQTFEVERS